MTDPVDIHVGQKLRKRRLELGMTQPELARAVGVRFQQIQKYETGQNRIAASRLWRAAGALNVPVCHFFPPFSDETAETAGKHRPDAGRCQQKPMKNRGLSPDDR